MEVNLQELEIGSIFHVKNGNWWGKIVNVDGDKYLEFLPQGVYEKYLGERSITIFDISEIRANRLARESGKQRLEEEYKVIVDYVNRKEIKYGRI